MKVSKDIDPPVFDSRANRNPGKLKKKRSDWQVSALCVQKNFESILVANRGEIACRIISTVQKMGLRSITVYSRADQKAPHVGMADEAVEIDPGPAEGKLSSAGKNPGGRQTNPGRSYLSRIWVPFRNLYLC